MRRSREEGPRSYLEMIWETCWPWILSARGRNLLCCNDILCVTPTQSIWLHCLAEAVVRPIEGGCLRLGWNARQYRRARILLHQSCPDRTRLRADQQRVLREKLLSPCLRGRHRAPNGAGDSTNRKEPADDRRGLRILQENLPSHGGKGNTPDRGHRDPQSPQTSRIQDQHCNNEVHKISRRV